MRYLMIFTVLFAFVAMPAQAADLRTDADQSIACDSCGCSAAKADKADDKPCGCKGDCGCKKDKACGCGGHDKKADDKKACGCEGECKCKKDAAPEAGK